MFQDLFPIFMGALLATCISLLVEIREKKWKIDSIFIDPETGTSYIVKSNGDKTRCYINGFRVPKKWVIS